MTKQAILENLEDPYIASITVIGLVGIFIFLTLPYSKKRLTDNILPVLILFLVTFYENFGGYLIEDKAFNQKIHEWLFDVPFQGWNLWSFNLFYSQLSKLVFLFYLLDQVKGKKLRLAIHGLWISFSLVCIVLQWSGLEPLYDFQPIISGIGTAWVIVACCLFFIDLITNPHFLEQDLMKLWSFWFVTLTLFQSSLVFLSEISFEYLALNNKPLYFSLISISQFLYLAIMLSIVVKFVLESISLNRQNLTKNV